MSPTLAGFDATDGVLKNAVISGYFSLKPSINANGRDLIFRQFRRSAAFAAIASTVFYSVSLIRCWRVPPKVRKAIIPRISIIMTAFQLLGSLANKGCQNQGVGPKDFDLIFTPKPYKRAAIVLVNGIKFQISRQFGTHAAMIRNLIKALISYDGKPTFHSAQYGIIRGWL